MSVDMFDGLVDFAMSKKGVNINKTVFGNHRIISVVLKGLGYEVLHYDDKCIKLKSNVSDNLIVFGTDITNATYEGGRSRDPYWSIDVALQASDGATIVEFGDGREFHFDEIDIGKTIKDMVAKSDEFLPVAKMLFCLRDE